eukprot:jgi/Picre1/32762/NNA_008107.t1
MEGLRRLQSSVTLCLLGEATGDQASLAVAVSVPEPRHLLFSIAAGIKLNELESHLGKGVRVIRVMPILQLWHSKVHRPGVGPAYVYMMIEAMADGGVAAGLPRETALALAAQTVKGAAEMVLHGDEDTLTHPGVLKDRVASPAGTTIAAIAELEMLGLGMRLFAQCWPLHLVQKNSGKKK